MIEMPRIFVIVNTFCLPCLPCLLPSQPSLDHGGFVTIDFREHSGQITVVPVTGEVTLVIH